MGIQPPKIDERTYKDLLKEMKALAPFYTPEWIPEEEDAGLTLMMIMSRMLETIIQRLNKVPENNFTAFLDILGIKFLPARPAFVPVTFSLVDGAEEHVFIPERTQLAADDIIFESKKSIFATPSKLKKAFSTSVKDDGIYESPYNVVSGESVTPFGSLLIHTAMENNNEIYVKNTEGIQKNDILLIETGNINTEENIRIKNVINGETVIVSEVSGSRIKPVHKLEHDHEADSIIEKVRSFELFEGRNLQEHILYLGHNDLFNVKDFAEFEISFSSYVIEIADDQLVKWQYWGEDKETKLLDWYDFEEFGWSNSTTGKKLIIEKDNTNEIKETEINEKKSRWIRCIVIPGRIDSLKSIKIDTIGVKTHPIVKDGIQPDMIFYNDVPLEIPSSENPVYPFGTRPRQLDTFYIGSQEAFSKKDASITIYFGISGVDIPGIADDRPVIQVRGIGRIFAERLVDKRVETIGQLVKCSAEDIAEKITGETKQSRKYYYSKAKNILELAQKAVIDLKSSLKTEINKQTSSSNNTTTSDQKDLILSWEYWNGKGWNVIEELEGYENNSKGEFKFLTNGRVKFSVPENIDAVEVNGQKNYWIRVRIISGDFGRELVYDGGKWVPNEISLPTIKKITIYYEAEFTNLEHCLTYNNIEFRNVLEETKNENITFNPFQLLEDEHKTLYLGFDKKIEKGPISILFSIEELEIKEENIPKIEWSYYSQDREWVRLDVSDNTNNLTRTGTVKFFVPVDFTKTSRFSSELYWIKADDINDKIKTPPVVKGIYVNTAYAAQVESVKDEILGSSNAGAGQKFELTRIPVFTEEIWIDEMGSLSEEVKKAIIKENGEDYVKEKKDGMGKIREVWVRWRAVEDFFDSTPESRHYIIDRATGEVKFGDGKQGMIPPMVKNNIKAHYRVGGGVAGNVKASEIKTLKTSVPFIDKVINPLAAEGGADTEKLESVFERGPHLIKHRDRAVTIEDFERLAKEASNFIARTKCFIKENKLRIIVIPSGEEDKPTPSSELLKTARKYLLKRSLNLILPETLEIKKPDYEEVSVEVGVIPESMDIAVPLEEEILIQLKSFFHPIAGGPEKKGWGFGRHVHVSDVYALLEGIKGVDYVEKLKLDNQVGDFEVPEFKTVCSGKHRITMKPGE